MRQNWSFFRAKFCQQQKTFSSRRLSATKVISSKSLSAAKSIAGNTQQGNYRRPYYLSQQKILFWVRKFHPNKIILRSNSNKAIILAELTKSYKVVAYMKCQPFLLQKAFLTLILHFQKAEQEHTAYLPNGRFEQCPSV